MVATLEAPPSWLAAGKADKEKAQPQRKGTDPVSLEHFLQHGSRPASPKVTGQEIIIDDDDDDDDDDEGAGNHAAVANNGAAAADDSGHGRRAAGAPAPKVAAVVQEEEREDGLRRSAATLVICPMSLLSQWESECHTHLRDTRVLVYYGSERAKAIDTRFSAYDVIVTTYGVVTSEHFAAQREQAAPLFQVRFCTLCSSHGSTGQPAVSFVCHSVPAPTHLSSPARQGALSLTRLT